MKPGGFDGLVDAVVAAAASAENPDHMANLPFPQPKPNCFSSGVCLLARGRSLSAVCLRLEEGFFLCGDC